MYSEDYRAIGNAGVEGIKLAIFLGVIYYLFITIKEFVFWVIMMVKEIIFWGVSFFTGSPNLFIPIIFFLVLVLTWRISSSSSSLDWGIGFVTIHAASFLLPCLVYYYIYTTLSVDIINAISAYNQLAFQWVQSFDSILYYGAWAIYILAFILIFIVFALPIRFTRKAGIFILDKAYGKELYIIGDTIIIAVILSIATFLLSVMDFHYAIEVLGSFERSMIALFAITLLTAAIGWRKFLRQLY
ncbi:MAG: hypothetical protein Q9M11_03495 [Mariprofundaceae bacterium]|nr:hypothetical protein [Mariprofundaceae bacterium]